MIECYCDGCCEPINPGGTASYGAVILKDGHRIWQTSELIRPMKGREKETSNNVAEYSGLLAILRYLEGEKLQQEKINIFTDSMLIVKQMNHQWRIKQGFYVPYAKSCRKLLIKFPRLKIRWIPREKNSLADELSKAELLKAGIKFRIQPLPDGYERVEDVDK